MRRSTLPAHYLPKEHTLDVFLGERYATALRDLPEKTETCLDPMLCAAEFLDILAKKTTVDFWSDDLKEEEKRALLATVLQVKKMKGTVASIRRVLSVLGLDAEIKEGLDIPRRDGSYRYDGLYVHGRDIWWGYVLYLSQPVTIERSATVKKMLREFVPARSHLVALVFNQLNSRDGSIFYDNTHTHGTIGETNG